MATRSKSEAEANGDGAELETFYAPDGTPYQCANTPEKTRLLMAGYSREKPDKGEAEELARAQAAAVAGPPAPPTV
jgi:hypothetical protein